MSEIRVTKDNFEQLKSGEKPVLLDFYADWCGPCGMIAPLISEIAEEHPEITVGKVNVDDEPGLAQEFGIVSIPTLIVLRGGKAVNKCVGVRVKEQILEILA